MNAHRNSVTGKVTYALPSPTAGPQNGLQGVLDGETADTCRFRIYAYRDCDACQGYGALDLGPHVGRRFPQCRKCKGYGSAWVYVMSAHTWEAVGTAIGAHYEDQLEAGSTHGEGLGVYDVARGQWAVTPFRKGVR